MFTKKIIKKSGLRFLYSWKNIIIYCGISLSFGCTTTPDLSGWAKSSADLAGIVKAENKKIITRLDQNISELEVGKKEEWNLGKHTPEDWKAKRDGYFRNSSDINAVMDTMVLYASALANLAAAGETGGEAVDKIKTSVGKIVKLVGESNPISGATFKVLKEFASAWTKIEAQNTLAEAMTKIDPSVKNMASSLSDLTEAQQGVIDSLHLFERRLIRQSAGPNRMSWYVKNRGYKKLEEAFKDGADPLNVAATTILLESLERRYRLRGKRRGEVNQWRKERKRALANIEKAANAWSLSHSEAAVLLEECGGLHSLSFKCGNYSAANLSLAVETIRTVVADSTTEGDGE